MTHFIPDHDRRLELDSAEQLMAARPGACCALEVRIVED